MECRFYRGLAWIADRRGRHSQMHIGIVWIAAILQIFAPQVSVKVWDAVDHCWIALQRHVLF